MVNEGEWNENLTYSSSVSLSGGVSSSAAHYEPLKSPTNTMRISL
jgi:hypothetical protein